VLGFVFKRARQAVRARAGLRVPSEMTGDRQRLHSALGYRTPAEARASMGGITMLEAA
jgi:hypothetical protein